MSSASRSRRTRKASSGWRSGSSSRRGPPLGTAGAVIGWYVVSLLASHRDRENKRREIRVQHLIAAYRHLEAAAGRKFTEETFSALRAAISEIQLLGSARVVDLADQWVEAYIKGRGGKLSSLAEALRSELCAELGLEQLHQPPKVLHFTLDDKGQNSSTGPTVQES